MRTSHLNKWLEKEHISLNLTEKHEGIDKTKSFRDFVFLFYPNLNKNNVNLLLERILEANKEIKDSLILFLKNCFNQKISINTISFLIKSESSLQVINLYFEITELIKTTSVDFERFLINSLKYVEKKNWDFITHHIHVQDTLFAYKRLIHLNMNEIIPKKKIRNIFKLHDFLNKILSHQYFLKKDQNLLLIETHPLLRKINNKLIPELDLSIKVPQASHELCNWGLWMNNCVATYTYDCLQKRSIILGLFDSQGFLRINIEIRKGQISQIFKKNNQEVNNNEKEEIINFLLQHDLITSKEKIVHDNILEAFERLLEAQSS